MTSQPFKVFETEDELVEFVEGALARAQKRAHDEQRRLFMECAQKNLERGKLRRELIGPGDILANVEFLKEARDAVCEILENLADLKGDVLDETNQAAILAFSRLTIAIRNGETESEEEDFDTSDNSEEAAE